MKTDDLLPLMGQIAQTCRGIVGGEGLNGPVTPVAAIHMCYFLEVLRKQLDQYDQAIMDMARERK